MHFDPGHPGTIYGQAQEDIGLLQVAEMINSQPVSSQGIRGESECGGCGVVPTILGVQKATADTRRSKYTVRRARCEEQARREQSKNSIVLQVGAQLFKIEQQVQTAKTSGPVQLKVLQHRTACRLALESAVLVTRISTCTKCSIQSAGCFVAHLQNVVCLNVLFGKVGEGSDRQIWLEDGKPLRSRKFPSP